MRSRSLAATGFLLGTVLTSGALAHPHVWIDSSAQFRFDGSGQVRAVTIIWRFDDLYSAFAIQGADENQDGVTTAEELTALGNINVDYLKQWNYFTNILADGEKVAVGSVDSFSNVNDDGILVFSFTLPLVKPVDPRRQRLRMSSVDPSYYIAFQDDPDRPAVAAGDMPPECSVVTYGPEETPQTVSDSLAMSLAADQNWASSFAPKVAIECAD